MLARRCPMPGRRSASALVSTVVASLLVVLALGTGPAVSAQAAAPGATTAPIDVSGIRAWPTSTVTVFDSTDEPAAVDRALLMWNTSSAGISFEKVLDINSASVVISNTDLPGGDCQGQAMVGYTEGWQSTVLIDASADPRKCTWASHILLVAHELGHVAGLPHITGQCSLMNPINTGNTPLDCKAPKWAASSLWRCRGPEPIDLATLSQLYAPKAASSSRGTWCRVPGARR